MYCSRDQLRAAFDHGVRATLAHLVDGAERPRNPHSPNHRPAFWWRRGSEAARAAITRIVELGP